MSANNEILVIGHHNPDTDAICSALAYADLHARTTGTATVACYLDDIGPETQWLLRHLGLAAPRAISDVYWRVRDVMRVDAPSIGPDTTLREAGLLMREYELGALPVLENQQLIGLVPRDLLADRYLGLLQLSSQIDHSLAVLRRTLDAQQLAGPTNVNLQGQVWVGTFSPEVARAIIRPGDLVIVEDDSALQQAVVAAGAGCLVIARAAPIADELVPQAEAQRTVLISTAYDSLAVAALIEQSAAVSSVMQYDPTSAHPSDMLTDVQQHLRLNRLASVPVIDNDNQYQGLLLRRALVPQNRRRIILTDHNHAGQAVAGAAESEIIAIIDHHNLGGLQTLQPLTIQIEPVGCTCTLIAEGYQRADIMPSPQIAGAMLGAILSDTVQFRSPTTTPRDRAAADWLAHVSGQQIEQLARSMFRARLPNPTPPPDWWVSRDWKTFTFGAAKIGIAQMELVDVEDVMPSVESLCAALQQQQTREGLTAAFLMLTDILDQSSLLLAANAPSEQLAQRAFDVPVADHALALPGVMSRKKQVVPALAAALEAA